MSCWWWSPSSASLAAVAVPNVGKFIGKGAEEAQATEMHNVQTATMAMMASNPSDNVTAGTIPADGDGSTIKYVLIAR